MPLDEGRRIIWQTTPKAPMGELLDQGRLTRADTLSAVTKAYCSDVRRAAQRLLEELDNRQSEQSTPPPIPPDSTAAPAGLHMVIASLLTESAALIGRVYYTPRSHQQGLWCMMGSDHALYGRRFGW